MVVRRLVALVLLIGVTAVTGCTGDDSSASPKRSPSSATSSNPPSDEEATTSPPVRPNPPARYRPAWPRDTVTNAKGYLVDDCVPKRLRDNAISMTDGDGVHLSGLVLGTGTDGVLLSHEQGYSVCSFLDLAERLAADGYQVLLPEYRNHGASERSRDNEHIDRDARTALRELQRRGAERVFIGGASCGGTTSAIVGATIPHLVGLLNMSSPVVCGSLRSIPALRRITAPSLFIVSPGDMQGAVEEQVRQGYAADASKDKRLIIDRSGFHGTDMFRASPDGSVLQETVLRFIERSFASSGAGE